MFDYELTEELKAIIKKLNQKDRKKSLIIAKKVEEIISNDLKSIDRYKNLRSPLQHLKRVHIDQHFVLTFQVNKEKNFILFVDFDHHDNVY
ncbi:addiction module toxin RelE [Candidatus Woesearchaeota archaeon]|nr:addiction module toxin RelE [Candidatus Woesearchaeota archaeon]